MNVQYLAGFLDGEGYFGLYRKHSRENSYVCAIKTAQIESGLPVLEAIREKYGGSIRKRKMNQENRRQSYHYSITGKKNLQKLLEDIIPHLIVKKQQAELLLEYCNMPMIHPNWKSQADEYEELLSRKHEIAKEIKRLINK